MLSCPAQIGMLPSAEAIPLAKAVNGILYSVDFPLIGQENAREFLERAPISETDKKKIAYANTEHLFRIGIN